jgi:nucleoside-diphosphate-sugar epimerase
MKVLVTGGAGYLGSILSEKLLSKGYQVRIIDGLWYGKDPVKPYLKNPNFELIEADIRNLNATVSAMKDVDAVIHLASIVGMPASNIEPRTSEEINYLATKNIAELCDLHEIPSYIFASTCSVYGAQPNKMITEKTTPAPLDYYAKSKFQSERAINWLNSGPAILRFGTLFGLSPRMRFDLVINLFIAQALNNEKIIVEGGQQSRPFLHVQDAADALIFILEKDLEGTYNVISENMTILEAAKRISKVTGCEIEIRDDIIDKRDYTVSANKIKQFGFEPTKNLEYAINEIKRAFESGQIKNYNDMIYSNYKLLFSSKEMQQKVFVQGLEKS